MSDLEVRIEKLEQRVRDLEDRVVLHEMMVRYGPAVDAGSTLPAQAPSTSNDANNRDQTRICDLFIVRRSRRN